MTKKSDFDCRSKSTCILFALGIAFGIAFSLAPMWLQAQQTPDWMFALEGSYVGRFEVEANDSEEIVARDSRIDGLRNGKEDGFVLQISIESNQEIEKSAQMWTWNQAEGVIEVAALSDRQAQTSKWFVSSEGLTTTLTRGASDEGKAVIERWRLERLPGQLRWDKSINTGDGEWQFRWRYVLDEFVD